MRTHLLATIAVTLLAAFSLTDRSFAQADKYAPLVAKIEAVSCAAAGPVFGVDPSWVPIVGGDEDTSHPSTFAMARGYGSGRVILVGHDGLLTQSVLTIFDNAQFMKNMVEWLNQIKELSIAYTTGHSEWVTALPIQQVLTNTPTTILALAAPITKESLDQVSVLIVGNAWGSFTAQEVEAVRQFVQNGGGLLLAGLGWSWSAYNPTATMQDYPMHEIAAPYGGRWLRDTITDSTDQVNGYPIFRSFYPNVASCTPSEAMTAIVDAHQTMGSGLPGNLETNGLLRSRLIAAHANLAAVNTEFPIGDPLRAEVSDFYTDLARRWHDSYTRTSPIDESAYPTSVWLRERAWRTLRDSLELTPARKKSLADVVQLVGRQRDLFLNSGLIVMDNCTLAHDQLEFLASSLFQVGRTEGSWGLSLAALR
jgi:hypothetical protein